jgi:hypothetical protein
LVEHAGYESVLVFAPQGAELAIPLRAFDPTRAGGARGMLDVSAELPNESLLQGMVAAPFDPFAPDLGIRRLFCDFVPTLIDAPELGLDQAIHAIPGGAMIALGIDQITSDALQPEPRRCPRTPNANELGCFAATAPAGVRAMWGLAGKTTLPEATRWINRDEARSFFCRSADLPLPLPLAFPWVFREARHGLALRVDVREHAKVARGDEPADCTDATLPDFENLCGPNFSEYSELTFTAEHELSILSRTTVARLPARPGASSCLEVALVTAGVLLPDGALLPLGFAAGIDSTTDDVPDCRPETVVEPFGELSTPLSPGVIPLWMAPPHSGAEAFPLLILSIAKAPGGANEERVELAARIFRPATIGEDLLLSEPHLPLPSGTLDLRTRAYTSSVTSDRATATKLILRRGKDSAAIWAPATMSTIALPARLETLLGNDTRGYVSLVATHVPWNDLFRLAFTGAIDAGFEAVEAISVEECRSGDAPCRLVPR